MAKKLLYLSHARLPSEKTPSPFILKTCEGLVTEGYEVELWVANRRNILNVDPFEYNGIKTRFPIRRIFCLDFVGFTGKLGFPLMVLTYNLSVWFHLFREKGIILYAHDIRDVLFAPLFKPALFVEVHDFYQSSISMLNRWVIPYVTGWIVTNSIKRDRMMREYALSNDRMIVQPNAVDFEMFALPISKDEARRELGLPQDRRIIMYTGHLYAWKGVFTLAQAARFLPKDIDIYFVGGTDSDRASLEAYIRTEKLERITLVPHQPHAKIPLFQKAADALVLPNTAKEDASKYETSPVKLFEYLASGTPIVASDIPSIREIVSEKEVLFAKPDDAEDFARAIEEAVHDTTRHDAAIALAKKHSWESRARAIREFIERSL